MHIFFSEDSADEVIGSGIDGIVAVFVFGCDRIMFTFELGIEARHDRIQEGLLLGLKGRFVLEGIDEFLREVGGIAEGGHVSPFAEVDGAGFVVTRVRGIGFESADFGDVAIEVMEGFLALDESAVRACHFCNLRVVLDFSHSRDYLLVCVPVPRL